MIYFLRHVETGLIKIGVTRTYALRYDTLRREYGALELLGLMDGGYEIEQSIQSRFKVFNVYGQLRGEEWFSAVPELLRFIKINTSLNLPLPFTIADSKHYPSSKGIKRPKRPRAPKNAPGIHNRLEILIKQKSVELGRKLTIIELSNATGISRQVIHSWLRDEVQVIHVKVSDAFCKYFECNVSDLLVYVPDEDERELA